MRRSTSQGKNILPTLIPFLFYLNLNLGRSDTGYMTTSGPCPIFEGLVPVYLFECAGADDRGVFFFFLSQRSAPNTGPLTSPCFPSGEAVRSPSSPASAFA